jgi:hypothetical protein
VALELYLMCPGNETGQTLTPDPPQALLRQIMSREGTCRWFEE